MESELGATLLSRTQRRVALTEAGQALLGRARHLLAEAERARLEVRRVANGEAGVLSVGYTPTASHRVLPATVPRFRKQHPDVRLELTELRSASQPDALREGRIELGLVCAPLAAPGLVETPLVAEKLVVALPSRHPLVVKKALRPRDLDGQAYVGVRPEVEPAWAEASVRALSLAGCTLDLVQETDTKISLLGLVAAGLGVSLVSESLTELTRRGVVFRPLLGLKLRLVLSALGPASPSARAAAFLALLRQASSQHA